MNVTIRQLKAFLEISEQGSFRAASVNLGMSQPSLSSLLKNLEYELGASLFTRTTRRVTLTDEGKRMIVIAQGLVRNFDLVIGNAKRDIHNRDNLASIAISVSSTASLIFPSILNELSLSHPHIKVRLVSGLSRDMSELVALGDADLGIVSTLPDPKHLSAQKLLSDRLVVVGLPDAAVMQDNSPMDWATLRHQRCVAWSSGGGMREVIDTMPELAELMSEASYEASNWVALKGLINKNLGLAIVPWIIAHQERGNNLVYRDIEGTVPNRDVFLIERLNSDQTDATKTIADLVRKHMHKLTQEKQKTK